MHSISRNQTGNTNPDGYRKLTPVLSVVVPMCNESRTCSHSLSRLVPVLERIGMEWEIVCIDDGSSDNTALQLAECRKSEPRLKIVRLSRNFGKEVGLAAGLKYARGDALVLMDADLQHPPELIETFVDRWRAGFDMVYGIRRRWHGASRARQVAGKAFYKIFAVMTHTRLPRGAGDFRLLDRCVVDALNLCTERSRFTNGLYAWVGFRHIGVPFDVDQRVYGRSGWSLFALWRFAVDAITAFSMMPLRVWSYIGVVVSLLALTYGAFIVVRTLIFGSDVPGYASLIAAITFFAGVQLIGLGVIGEYLGRVFTEVKRRPLFIVAEEVGFDMAQPVQPPSDESKAAASSATDERQPIRLRTL
ncbi:MAG: glycosyltransferase family 2 protein [Rhodospirillales bacterium]|nr:glycosyltransferase family 2 protein [Rhodospirillales bacterium]